MKKTAICVLGWHYNEKLYQDISSFSEADVFVVSHKPAKQVPSYIYKYVSHDHVFIEPNKGYDWGGYQQFLEKDSWRNYQCIVFMHDDVVIRDLGVLAACCDLLKRHWVVGNSRCQPKIKAGDFARSYAHSSWKPQSPTFIHDNVRGSFFAVRREALEQIGCFEVFWDRFNITSGYGNWSTRASCGKLEFFGGPECFAFLSETPCVSSYLDEEVRGGAGIASVAITSRAKSKLESFIYKISTDYMIKHWSGKCSVFFNLRQKFRFALIKYFFAHVLFFGR